MRVTFRTNLGSIDAGKYGLDWSKCQAGKSLDVADDVAMTLAKRGLIEPIKAVPKPPVVRAVPPPPEPAEKASADLEAYREKAKRKPKYDDAE